MHRVVKGSLRQHTFELDTATDGAVALVKALAQPPDLIISDVVMPGMCGWTLVRRLRAEPALAFVPFIFITSLSTLEDMLRGFQLGADDYLSKPFRPEELEARVLSVLRRREQLEGSVRERLHRQPLGDPSMRGSLKDIGLSSLLVLLEMERKSGHLVITRAGDDGESCRLFLREGRIHAAEIAGGPALRNSDAVYHALMWPDGGFEFDSTRVEIDDEIGASTTFLLIEGARRLDESLGPQPGTEPAPPGGDAP